VRRALNLAVDRERFVAEVLQVYGLFELEGERHDLVSSRVPG